MRRVAIKFAGSLLAVTGLCVSGASAASLLGVVGTNGDSGLVTLNSGAAQTNGAVNVGLGSSSSSPNNVLSVGVGSGSSPLATANVGSGGSNGALSVNANVGGLANVGVGVGGGSGNGGTGGNGGNGGNGLPGGNGGNGLIIVGNGGGGGTLAPSFGAGCNDANSVQALQMVAASKYNARIVNGWSRASNVQVVPIKLCSSARANLPAAAAANGTFGIMQQAVMTDPLISTSLTRAKSNAGRVLAVNQAGPMVTVYVY